MRAGTVEVVCAAAGADEPGTAVAVSYDLTALSAAGDHWLTEFAAGYAPFLEQWRVAIAGSLATG